MPVRLGTLNPPIPGGRRYVLDSGRACGTTEQLALLELPLVPPVFLLDANRDGLAISYGPGWFDNRSFITPQTAPVPLTSAPTEFRESFCFKPSGTLAAICRFSCSYRGRGMSIAIQAPGEPWAPRPVIVKPPMFIISAWQSLRRRFGYRRDNFPGWFGGIVPPSRS